MKQVTDTTLADTGERMIPAHHKGNMVYGEHVVRYEAVLPLVKGKTVLDIASGSGYGSALIGESAQKVIGVDIDAAAVAYAKKNYSSEHVTFRKGDGVAIPLKDDTVDVVVCFETIEHIEDYKKFMKEVKRVLRTDGLLILSTPNDIEFIEGNHFHIHEFEYKELAELVAKYFKHMKPYFQATWLYNALMSEKELKSEWRQPLDTLSAAPVTIKKCTYFFLLCSNREVSETVPSLGAISEHYSEREVQELETKQAGKMAELEQKLFQIQTDVSTAQVRADQLQHELKVAKVELENIYQSKAWKVARGMQKVAGSLRRKK